MDVFIVTVASIILVYYTTKNKKMNIMPLQLALILNIGVLTMPGIVMISFFTPDTLVNQHNISEETKNIVLVLYLISFFLIVVATKFAINIENKLHVDTEVIPWHIALSFLVSIVGLLIIVVLQRGLENIPLYSLINGDPLQAAINKKLYMTKMLPTSSEVLNQLLRFGALFLYFYQLLRYFSNKTSKGILVSSFIVVCIVFTLDGHKGPLLFIIIGSLYIIFLKDRSKFLIKYIFYGFLLFISFIFWYAYALNINQYDISFLFEKFVERAFFLQSAGMYIIIETFDPDINLIKHGMIGASYLFDDLPPRAFSVIMEELYGYSDTNVNMNSYFISEAYSWGGLYGALASSIIIFFHIIISNKIIAKFSRNNYDMYVSLSLVYYLFYFPLVQGFNSFLYFRNLAFFTFCCLFVLFMLKKIKFSAK